MNMIIIVILVNFLQNELKHETFTAIVQNIVQIEWHNV